MKKRVEPDPGIPLYSTLLSLLSTIDERYKILIKWNGSSKCKN